MPAGRGCMTANCANFANVAALPLVVGHLMRKENWLERERRNLSGQGARGMVWMASFLAMTRCVCSLVASCLVCFVVPPRNDAKRAWGRSPEMRMLNDTDFFNGWSLRPTGGLPLRVIASVAKQSKHEVIKEIVILETY